MSNQQNTVIERQEKARTPPRTRRAAERAGAPAGEGPGPQSALRPSGTHGARAPAQLQPGPAAALGPAPIKVI